MENTENSESRIVNHKNSEIIFLVFEGIDVEVDVSFDASKDVEKFTIIEASLCLIDVTDIFSDFIMTDGILKRKFKNSIIEIKNEERSRKRQVLIPNNIKENWEKFSVKIYDLDIEGYFLAEGSCIKKYVFSSVDGCSDMLYVDFIENYIHSIPKKEKEFLEVLEKHKNNNSKKFMDITQSNDWRTLDGTGKKWIPF